MIADNITVAEIKKTNRNNIYRLLRAKPNSTKQDIVADLKLSLPTVTTNLVQFIEAGLVVESGSFGNAIGRRASTFSIVPEAKIAIGIDITKKYITIVGVNLIGEIVYRKRFKEEFKLNSDYCTIVASIVKELSVEQKYSTKQILGVGIGIPGLIKNNGQTVFYGKTLTDFTGLTIDFFQEFIPYPCRFIKDANAACLAETWFAEYSEDVFYISLSNYVGGSVRINNKEYIGEGTRSGEVGHITIIPDGLACYCGKYGCVDTYCSALRLSEHVNEDLDTFFKQLRNKDQDCLKKFDEYIGYLALAVNNVRMLFDCKIILGGYVGAYFDDYLEKLKTLLAERNSFEHSGEYVAVCKWKRDAIAAGAAILYLDEFMKGV
ncbi:ROK family protein [Lachnospiraceae bacterium ZAX-1]